MKIRRDQMKPKKFRKRSPRPNRHSNPTTRHRKVTGGFTLIEVLVTVFGLSLAGTCLYFGFRLTNALLALLDKAIAS